MRAMVCLALLVGCASSSGPGTSGVEGIVLIGPQCPVMIEGQVCPDEPFEADLRIVARRSGSVVATVRRGPDGRFTVLLEPGEYTIEPVPPTEGGLPFGTPVEVVVRANAYTEVTVLYDTGIR